MLYFFLPISDKTGNKNQIQIRNPTNIQAKNSTNFDFNKFGKFGAKDIGKIFNGGNFGTNMGNLGTNIGNFGTELADKIGTRTDDNAQTIGNSDNVDKTEILRHRFRLPATTEGKHYYCLLLTLIVLGAWGQGEPCDAKS